MENQTMIALRMVNMGIRRQMESFRSRNGLDTSAGVTGWVLGYLADHEHEDVYQRDLEKELGVCRSAVSRIVAALEKSELLERSRVASDDRLKKLILTDHGRACTEQIRAECSRLEALLMRGFTPEETAQMRLYLQKMQQNLKESY